MPRPSIDTDTWITNLILFLIQPVRWAAVSFFTTALHNDKSLPKLELIFLSKGSGGLATSGTIPVQVMILMTPVPAGSKQRT